jgi:hypothetical protein
MTKSERAQTCVTDLRAPAMWDLREPGRWFRLRC